MTATPPLTVPVWDVATDPFATIRLPSFYEAFRASRPLLAHTRPGAATDLLSWSTLADTIRIGTFLPGDDFCFVGDRTEVPIDEYSRLVPSDRAEPQRELIPDRVQTLLREGMTLRVKDVHRRVPGLRELGQLIESVAQEPVGCNLYGVHNERPAFGLHADPHDIVVVQLEGTKRWVVHAPESAGDLDPRISNRARVAPAFEGIEPTFDVVLEAGDVLYLPRSWWHTAVAAGGASLHVTFAVRRPIALDLVHRALDRVVHLEPWRSPLPRFGTVHDRVEFAERLATAIAGELTADAIEAHFADRDAAAVARFTVDLAPEAASDLRVAPQHERWRLIASRPLVCHEHGPTIEIRANGRSVVLPSFVRPIIDQLVSSGTISKLDVPAADRDFAALAFERLQQLGVITRDRSDASPLGADAVDCSHTSDGGG